VTGALLGQLGLCALRGRSIRAALAVIVLTSVVVIAAAVTAVGALMLVSGHALVVLIAAVAAGGLAGLVVATTLGRSVVRSSAALQEALERLGGGEAPRAATPTDASAELAMLATDLDRAHQSLTAARERERALEASRRELVAWVSHDLRTPLAGLRAMTEALEDEVVADEPTVRTYHQRMRIEVERLAAMIDDLFEFSQINAGALQLTWSAVDLGALVTDAVAASVPLARRRRVNVVANTQGATTTVGDAYHLDRAMRNLLTNAIRHTPADGTVTVTAAADATGTLLAVGDQCGGIPEDDLPRLFDVGFRGSRARSPEVGYGAGLGLAIARGIVTAHSGNVAVTNVPGGCRFEIRLPDSTQAAPNSPGTGLRATRPS
jgi:signal transduction histidine kinase